MRSGRGFVAAIGVDKISVCVAGMSNPATGSLIYGTGHVWPAAFVGEVDGQFRLKYVGGRPQRERVSLNYML